MAADTPLTAAASAGPHTSAPRRRVEDRPRDLVVTTYAMLTRQPWLADVFILSLKAGGIWWNPAVENQATDRARFASASTATCESPQMRVGSGGASSMPPQQRNSIEINAPGEWKP